MQNLYSAWRHQKIKTWRIWRMTAWKLLGAFLPRIASRNGEKTIAVWSSIADVWHFGTDPDDSEPDPRIRSSYLWLPDADPRAVLPTLDKEFSGQSCTKIRPPSGKKVYIYYLYLYYSTLWGNKMIRRLTTRDFWTHFSKIQFRDFGIQPIIGEKKWRKNKLLKIGPFYENLAKTRLQIFLANHILFLVGPFALWSSAAECSASWQHCPRGSKTYGSGCGCGVDPDHWYIYIILQR